MEGSNTVLSETSEGVLTLTLNRPKANAFNMEMIAALSAALKSAARDETVRCVLLTGSGGVFSAGQDVKDFQQEEEISFRKHLQNTYNPLVVQIRKLEKPVLAAINGPVAGAALGMHWPATCASPRTAPGSWWDFSASAWRPIRRFHCYCRS
jgi:2-(1,2-epoxy-1,2-dihydrophenyl)acetyl-CoA isomerase